MRLVDESDSSLRSKGEKLSEQNVYYESSQQRGKKSKRRWVISWADVLLKWNGLILDIPNQIYTPGAKCDTLAGNFLYHQDQPNDLLILWLISEGFFFIMN